MLSLLLLGMSFLSLCCCCCHGFVVVRRQQVYPSPAHPQSRCQAKVAPSSNDTSTDSDHDVALQKATKAMTAFTNKYLKNTNTRICQDPSVAAVVIKGLAEHKVALGSPLCPCRFYEDKEAEAKDGYWNCPCVPMRERHECHCMLFLTEENDFSGDLQVRTVHVCLENDLTYFIAVVCGQDVDIIDIIVVFLFI
jgi:ferredoxin-thioredoxin reductase catalytic chain